MGDIKPTTAQQIAQAVMTFQRECTGRAPESISVLLGGETLVVTLHGSLSPAEKEMARTPEGAARVGEFHRQLFLTAADALYQDLNVILGVAVREAAVEMETGISSIVEVFPSGTLVQVYHLAQSVETETWSMPKSTTTKKSSNSRTATEH